MQWEYSVLNIVALADASEIKSTLNVLGMDGWELVATLPKTDGHSSGFLFLKRQKSN